MINDVTTARRLIWIDSIFCRFGNWFADQIDQHIHELMLLLQLSSSSLLLDVSRKVGQHLQQSEAASAVKVDHYSRKIKHRLMATALHSKTVILTHFGFKKIGNNLLHSDLLHSDFQRKPHNTHKTLISKSWLRWTSHLQLCALMWQKKNTSLKATCRADLSLVQSLLIQTCGIVASWSSKPNKETRKGKQELP